MKHVSIVGSCLLRDVFNSKFVPGWSDDFRVDSYFARTTVPSIMSAPLEYDLGVLEKKFSALKFEYHYTECAKCMLQILENNASDYILFDFYADAFYGTYLYRGNYYGGWSFGRLLKRQVIDKNEKYKLYNFASDPDKYFEIWCNAYDHFMDYAGQHFQGTKIIINGIKGSNEITKDGKFIGIQTPEVDLKALNTLWKRFDDYAREQYQIPVLEYEKKYTLDPDYIYGLNHELVHFHGDYYMDAFQKIKAVCSDENQKGLLSNLNLIRNSDFCNGLKYWYYRNSEWQVIENNGKNWLCIKNRNQKLNWQWIWCDPIEINGDGIKKYRLSMTIKLQELIDEPEVTVVGYRTFKRAVGKTKTEAIQKGLFAIRPDEIRSGEEYKCSFCFRPVGKFIRIAPHIKKEMPGIYFTDIKLTSDN